ncbi:MULTISPECIES: hypothetical protein [unclassified Actinotalea]|uniref:hypothetical protein n=1 Tax=unclassified Actinotalea TaxID=2638618 RepID=UPI0015F35338|nr:MULTISPECIES: hypothetical protein [unclassified Actinotalea]
MSAAEQTAVRATARTAPAPSPGRRRAPEPAPRLRVVRAPAQARTRVPFVVLCMALLAASLLGALLLNTSMAQGEYERLALQQRLAESSREQERIATELRAAESSTQLAAAATALGMVPTTHGAYLRLADGAVLGDPVPAGAEG